MSGHIHPITKESIHVNKVNKTDCVHVLSVETDAENFYVLNCEGFEDGTGNFDIEVQITINSFNIQGLFDETRNLDNRRFLANPNYWDLENDLNGEEFVKMNRLGRACTPDTKIDANNTLITFKRNADEMFYMPMTAFMDIRRNPVHPEPGLFFICFNQIRIDELEWYNMEITLKNIERSTQWRLISYDMELPPTTGLIYYDRGHPAY